MLRGGNLLSKKYCFFSFGCFFSKRGEAMRTKRAWVLGGSFLLALLGPLGAQTPPNFIVPSGNPPVRMTSEPFGKGLARYQQVLSAQDIKVGPVNLKLMAFRPNRSSFSSSHKLDMEILMGNSAKNPSVMSTVFAQNVSGVLSTVVKRRKITLPALPGAGGFSVKFPFDKPYQYNGVSNILYEIRIYGNDIGNKPFFYDLDLAFSKYVSYVANYTSPVAASGFRQTGQGLLTYFEYGKATFTSFGKGCKGEKGFVPAIGNVGLPRIGSAFQVHVANIPGLRNVWLFTGKSKTSWGKLPLPFDLSPLGFSGCKLYTDVVFVTHSLSQGGTGNNGYAFVTLSIPAFPGFAGTKIYFQWMVEARSVPPWNIAFSNAAEARLDL